MPPTSEGLAFLEAFTEYIEWRIHHVGPPVGPKKSLETFDEFLVSKGADREGDAYKSLMARMAHMKDGRSTDIPPPQ